MDNGRLKRARGLSARLFDQISDEDELAFAERLLATSERTGESPWRLLLLRQTTAERLLELTRALNATRDLDALLEGIVDAAIAICGAERGVLILGCERPFRQLVARDYGGRALPHPDEGYSRTMVDRVVTEGRAVMLEDAQRDSELMQQASVVEMQLRSVLAGPLRLRRPGEEQASIGGVLYVDNRFAAGAFSAQNLTNLQVLCDQAAVAIETATLHRDSREQRRQVEELNAQLERRLATMAEVVDNQREQLDREDGYYGLLGESEGMRRVTGVIRRISNSEMPVLIQGKSGTGKELVARAVHLSSPRCDGPFISENVTAIPDSLVESELFGHVAGAFTGADRDKVGLFRAADGGTLFLDEVADMPMSMQKVLLRALQEGEVRPVGAEEPIPVDVRVIAAGNRPLTQLISEGAFREDLYFRLAGIKLELPTLRERRADIVTLAQHFVALEGKGCSITREALDALEAYRWPGNIRELRSAIRAAAALCSDREITLADLPRDVREAVRGEPPPPPPAEGLEAMLARVEREALLEALTLTGSKSGAARRLEITRYALNRKLQKYELEDIDV